MEGIGVRDVVDPKSDFLAWKRTAGDEWDWFKGNVRSLKCQRKFEALNHALRAHTDSWLRMGLLEKRRELIGTINDYKGDDTLLP